MLPIFERGDRVESIDTPSYKGTVVRARLFRGRGSHLQNVDVLLDADANHYARGKVLSSVNGCWQNLPDETGQAQLRFEPR
jgi:hypothetical protein